jgi:PAS domain S-box-containing protein
VLAGWWLETPVLQSIWPGGPHLTANGAVIFILLGTALQSRLGGARGSWWSRTRYGAGQGAALVAIALGVITLLEYLFGWSAGIDEWLAKDALAAERGAISGRPSFPTALSAVWLGLGLLLLDIRFRRIWPSQVLAVTSVIIAFLALIGHACDVPEFYGQMSAHRGTGMSVLAVAGFLALGVGLLCARAERGLMAVLWSHTPGGIMARWLMMAPAVGLLLTGIVYLALTKGVEVDHAIRTWALGLSNLIFVTVPIWVAAHALHEVGLECDRAHRALDERVRQRTAELTCVNAALHAEIAERRQAEDALRISEERYRIVADNTYAMEYWVDPVGRLSYVSPSCERITGYTASEFTADPDLLERLAHPEDRKLLVHHRNRSRATTAAPEQIEFRLLRRDRSQGWVTHHCQPLLGSGGQYLGQRASLQDITERKAAEESAREARTRLEHQAAELELRVAERTAKLRDTIGELEAFSYSVAHDMRAPLRGMQGFARLLLEEHAGHLNAEAHSYLERIASSASRMDMLIQDALNYTCVLRAETPLQPVDLDRLVRHIVATYPDWQSPQAEIRIEGALPPVIGHEGFLTQCISNLVGNAVKFVAPGITPRVRIWAETLDEHLRVCVEDNGIGIAFKDRDRIYRMFERINCADQYDGTGIGLAIVRKAVERMGGRVDFESELGKGTRFWIELARPAQE